MRIFGLMCVRNEADILDTNIRYHLSLGLECILAVDNGSEDDTARVLGRLAQSHPVRWCRLAGEFRQSAILSRLAYEAYLAGADWLLPIDADEFWHPRSRPLHETLRATSAGALIATVVNYVQRRDQAVSTPAALLGMTRRPPRPRGPIADIEALVTSRQIGFVEIEYPPKCIARASAATRIGQGNHWVEFAPGEQIRTDEIVCLHAPIRSRAQLDRKADCGRPSAHLAHQKQLAWHLRWWEKLGADGTLDAEWAANSCDEDGTLAVGSARRPTVEDRTLHDLVAPFVRASVLDDLPSSPPETLSLSRWIPHDLVDRVLAIVAATQGWLVGDLAVILMGAAAAALLERPGEAVVELGCYCGQSMAAIGTAAKAVDPRSHVYAIDPHEGVVGASDARDGIFQTFPTFEAFQRTMREAGIDDVVRPIVAKSFDVHWSDPIGLLFIDALHDYENVSRDYEAFAPFVPAGGYIVFDDCEPGYPGVVRCVAEKERSGELERVAQVWGLRVTRKTGDMDGNRPGIDDADISDLRQRLDRHEAGAQVLRQLLFRQGERHQLELRERDARIEALQAELFQKVGDANVVIRDLQSEMHGKIAEANRIIGELQAALGRASR